MPKVTQNSIDAFANTMKLAMAMQGKTLKMLANEIRDERAGFTPSIQFLSGIQNGKRRAGAKTVARIVQALDLDTDWIATFAGVDPAPNPTAEETRADQIIDAAGQSGAYERLLQEGITETAIIRLAQRIARDTEDLGTAWLELQNAMDMAVRVQADGHRVSNHPEFVDEARVAELAAQGEYASAGAEIDAALLAEREATEARQAKLLERGAEVAQLAGDFDKAAELIIAQADLAAGGRADLQDLRDIQDAIQTHGRDQGVLSAQRLAIALSHASMPRATTPDDRGMILNDIGIAQADLGERETGVERLEQAVEAYQNALLETTRDRVPMDWAITQVNLGTALQSLGQRETGTERLEQAIEAYQNALLEFTRDRVPMDWAMTQMNLGNALQTLGERETETERLEQSVEAYQNALLETTRDRVPMDWAMTQMNLGNALRNLGERETGTARLEQAVEAFQSALQENTRDRVPMHWASTQMNLGNALRSLGERETRTARLEQAVEAYQNALLENTRDRVPMQWAMVQFNLANLELTLLEKSHDPAHLPRARAYAEAAMAVFQEAGATQYIGMAERQLARIAELEA